MTGQSPVVPLSVAGIATRSILLISPVMQSSFLRTTRSSFRFANKGEALRKGRIVTAPRFRNNTNQSEPRIQPSRSVGAIRGMKPVSVRTAGNSGGDNNTAAEPLDSFDSQRVGLSLQGKRRKHSIRRTGLRWRQLQPQAFCPMASGFSLDVKGTETVSFGRFL
jgi:hypothetical protein